jgi:hypothetical protein
MFAFLKILFFQFYLLTFNLIGDSAPLLFFICILHDSSLILKMTWFFFSFLICHSLLVNFLNVNMRCSFYDILFGLFSRSLYLWRVHSLVAQYFHSAVRIVLVNSFSW